jgi:hypothetical protein
VFSCIDGLLSSLDPLLLLLLSCDSETEPSVFDAGILKLEGELWTVSVVVFIKRFNWMA